MQQHDLEEAEQGVAGGLWPVWWPPRT